MPVQPSLIKQVFEIPENALQDRHVDVFAIQIGVAVRLLVVAGFENDVDRRRRAGRAAP